MAKKKKQQEERKPDLAGPDQEVIEEKIKNMLDMSEPVKKDDSPSSDRKKSQEPKQEPNKVQIEVDDVSSAPELPVDAEKSEDPENSDKEIDGYEPKPEKVVNLGEAPDEDVLLEEMQSKAQESIDKKKSEDPETEVSLEEPLLEEENTKEEDRSKEEEPSVEKVLEELVKPNLEIESKETAKAVDDIIAKESDELLEIEDKKLEHAQKGEHKKLTLGSFCKSWWNNPKARWATILIFLSILVAVAVLPQSRYFVLNSLGIRESVTVVVTDESTGLPLKNVNVEIASIMAKTDSSGTAQLNDVKLGEAQLNVEKIAFAPISKKVTIGFGENKIDGLAVKPTGAQYSFVITDYLSGKPIEKVEAISGESSAFSDQLGKIKLTVSPTEQETLEIVFAREDYRAEKVTIPAANNTETGAVLVPAKKHIFISTRTGKYDLYSIDIDGKNETLLLPGTGSEREDIALSYRPLSNFAALVSTRDNQKNSDGFLLSNLNVVAVESGEVRSIASSERIQLIGWIGDRLVFVQAVSGASANDPNRHKLMSYDSKSNKTTELASSNYFNDVLVADERIYYAPSSAYQNTGTALYRVEGDGSGKLTILNQEVWNIFRIDYENLALSAQNSWFNVRIGEEKATSLTTQPTTLTSRIYSDSPDKKNSLWVDNRDGKGVLLNYQVENKNELSIASASGLRGPVNWLNKKDIVYRVSNEQETADYVISLDGGEPKKIIDVTNTNSLDKWYHY